MAPFIVERLDRMNSGYVTDKQFDCSQNRTYLSPLRTAKS
jgi:hypothetical protein